MDSKGLLYWIGIILVLWFLWPLIKSLIFIVLIIALILFLVYTFSGKDRPKSDHDYIERHDPQKPADDEVIDVEYKTKERK